MARGLNDYGYEYPSLSEIIDETKKSFKEAFGENFNTESNSVSDKIITLFGEREYQLWLLGGMVYSAQTIQGAEGIFLDDLLSKRGIYRNGKVKSTGRVQIHFNKNADYLTSLAAKDYTINSGDFVLQNDITVGGNISGQIILNSDLAVGNYSFNVYNASTATMNTLSLYLQDKTPGSTQLNSFFSQLKQFIVNNTIASNDSRIYINTASGSMYIGFDSSQQYIGLNNNIDFRTNPQIGTKIVETDVVASEPGYLPVGPSGITSISPAPIGFIKITNIDNFTGGADSETDAEYKIRALQAVSSTGAATRPAIIAKLLTVEGVQRVKIFNNPTPLTDSNGVPPYKFIPVVYGGTTEDISEALYEVIALNNSTWGDTSYTVTTEDGQPETIYHTKANVMQLAVRITYKTVNGKVLADDEKERINSALTNLVNSIDISGTLYNVQMVAEAVNAITDGRFSSFKIEVKLESEPDTAYSSSDFTTGLGDLLSLSDGNIVYLQG